MRLLRADRFLADYRRLPADIRDRADAKLVFLATDPSHPSLRVKRVRKYRGVYEASVNMDYRILFQIAEDECILLRIGRHDILEKL
jgi:mRNA interferase RelE/StbE